MQMFNKKIRAMICAALVLLLSFNISATAGTTVFGPVSFPVSPPQGWVDKTPIDNIFKISGSDRQFALLDCFDDNKSAFYVLAIDDYGTKEFDRDGVRKFDVSRQNNVAYWLNNEFKNNGNIVNSQVYKLPQQIIDNIDYDHIWKTECGENGSGFGASDLGKDYYETKAGISLMSKTEFVNYAGKFGTVDSISARGWFTRTSTTGGNALIYLKDAGYEGKLTAWDSRDVLGIRPQFYLNKDFFKNVKIDILYLGKNVKKAMIDTCSDADLASVGYSSEEINAIKDVSVSTVLDIKLNKDNAMVINAVPSVKIEINSVGLAAKCIVTYGITGGAEHNHQFTVSPGTQKTETLLFQITDDGVYDAYMFLNVNGKDTLGYTFKLSKISGYETQFMDSYSNKGVATHFALARNGLEDIELLKAAGIKVVRDEIYWIDVEREKGVFDFTYHDKYMNLLSSEGIEYVTVLAYDNPLYCTGAPNTEEEIAAFSRYASKVAQHYPNITAFEIWNEPNLPNAWGGSSNANEYSELVKAASIAIKAVRSDAKIYAGVVSGSDNSFIEKLFENGVYHYIDGISTHPYVYPENADSGNLENRLKGTCNIINKYGGFKDMSVTEIGWPTHNQSNGSTEEKQAAESVKAYVIGDAFNLDYMTLYDFKNDGINEQEKEDNFGIITKLQMPKLAYFSVKTFNEMLGGARYCGRLDIGNGVRAYIYNKRGIATAIIWNEAGATAVPVNFIGNTFVDMYGNAINTSVVKSNINPIYAVNINQKYLLQATSASAAQLFQNIKTKYWDKLSNLQDFKSIKYHYDNVQAFLSDTAVSGVNVDNNKILGIVDEIYLLCNKIIDGYYANGGNSDIMIEEITEMLNNFDQSVGFVLNMIVENTNTLSKLNANTSIKAAEETLAQLSDISKKYSTAILKRARNLYSNAVMIDENKDDNSLKNIIVYGNHRRAIQLAKWSTKVVTPPTNDVYVDATISSNGQFDLYGTAQEGSTVTVMVLKPNKTADSIKDKTGDLFEFVDFMSQIEVGENCKIRESYVLNDVSGIYTVRVFVNGFDEVYNKSIEYYSAKEAELLINAVKTAQSINDVAGLLKSKSKLLTKELHKFDTIIDDDVILSKIAEILYNNTDSIQNIDELISVIIEPCIVYYINNNSEEEMQNDLNTFDYIFKTSESNSYKTYVSGLLSDSQRNEIMCKVLATDVLSIADFNDRLAETIVLYAISNLGYKNIMSVLIQNNNLLNIDYSVYNTLTESKQIEVLKEFTGTLYSSLSDAENRFASILLQVKNSVNNSGFVGGGGIGGGSGGAGGGHSGTGAGTVGVQVVPSAENGNLNSTVFKDVSKSYWAAQSIVNLYNLGIINGRDASVFAPEDYVSREEFVKMLIMAFDLLDETATVEFEDVSSNEWYYQYVASGVKYGIVNGVSLLEFGIGMPITREQMATLCCRMINENVEITDGVFVDETEISPYAKEAVLTMQSLGMINGVGGGRFAPKELVTRAQAATIIDRMLATVK